MKTIEILVDFDGTCVTQAFPKIGENIGAIPVLKELVDNGHRLILFTMRSDSKSKTTLTDAVNWFKDNNIPLYGIQKNPTQHNWTSSPKAYGHLIIDDIALGCPLIYDESVSHRPYVDWSKVREMLVEKELLK
jgi:hypothetical protein